jgi:predicted DNA-binding protein YlxM (UPF0122 family)
MADERVIDWIAIEAEYRAGVRTIQDIADQHGVSKGAIGNRAKRGEWTRDLKGKIQAQAEILVNKARVNKEVNKKLVFTEKALVKSAAELQAGALLQESEEIKRLSKIADDFEEELQTMPMDVNGAPLDLERKTRILKQVTEVREKIINLRRRNLGINDNANGEADKKAPITNINYTIIDPQQVEIKQAVVTNNSPRHDGIRTYA